MSLHTTLRHYHNWYDVVARHIYIVIIRRKVLIYLFNLKSKTSNLINCSKSKTSNFTFCLLLSIKWIKNVTAKILMYYTYVSEIIYALWTIDKTSQTYSYSYSFLAEYISQW
jgi:hypothetical protein